VASFLIVDPNITTTNLSVEDASWALLFNLPTPIGDFTVVDGTWSLDAIVGTRLYLPTIGASCVVCVNRRSSVLRVEAPSEPATEVGLFGHL
jgi:hypothetical protein